jgi:hypothetical protein
MMARTWTSSDPRWQSLNPYQRAAAMALMEADRMDPESAKHALGAMINRSAKEGVDLGEHVSQPIYQPTIEANQQARLDRILQSPQFGELTGWAERRMSGNEPDPVNGATHFLAPEKTMLALERQNPSKYRNWGPRGANWTGFDPATNSYNGVVMRDASHAFLAPEGAHSVPGTAPKVNTAQNGSISGGTTAAPAGIPSPAPVQVASAPQVGLADDGATASLMASMFGKPEQQPQFQSVMGQQAAMSAAAIPKAEAPPIEVGAPVKRPLDITQLLSVIANRQKLGVA